MSINDSNPKIAKQAISQPLPPMYPGGLRIDEEEEAAVLEVIRSKRLFRYYGPQDGPSKVAELEDAFSAFMGTRFGLAVTSGTAALICALNALGIGPGDEVIVPAYTWISSASAVVAVGAVPIIVEVDDSFTIDPLSVESHISPYTKAVIPVHMRGAPCKMDALLELAIRRNLLVLEDSAQATGASYHGKRLGSLGHAGAYSLQFNKIITSGEGGMLITNDEYVYNRAVMYHDVIGGQRNKISSDQILPGVNFRMPELLAAVELVQLRRLEGLLSDMRQRKQMIKSSMTGLLAYKGGAFRVINDLQGDASIAIIFTLPEVAAAQRVSQELRNQGLNNMVMYSPGVEDYHIYSHWTPLMNQRAWTANGGPWKNHPRKVEYHLDDCPRSLDMLSRAVHIDVSPDLTNSQVEEVCEVLQRALNQI